MTTEFSFHGERFQIKQDERTLTLILLKRQKNKRFTEVLRQSSERKLKPGEFLKTGRQLADAFETLEEEIND